MELVQVLNRLSVLVRSVDNSSIAENRHTESDRHRDLNLLENGLISVLNLDSELMAKEVIRNLEQVFSTCH